MATKPPWGTTEDNLDGKNYPDGWPCACGPDCRAPGGCMYIDAPGPEYDAGPEYGAPGW
jgi:hypothetical protein